MAATGWTVPTSLFACITDTSAVVSDTASRTASGDTTPLLVDGQRPSCVHPRRASAREVCSTASCSIPLTTISRRPVGSSASAAPRMARLSDSVPPAVKTTSDGSPPISAATDAAGHVDGALRLLPEAVDARGIADQVAHRPASSPRRRPRPAASWRCDRDRSASGSRSVASPLTAGTKTGRQRFRRSHILTGPGSPYGTITRFRGGALEQNTRDSGGLNDVETG